MVILKQYNDTLVLSVLHKPWITCECSEFVYPSWHSCTDVIVLYVRVSQRVWKSSSVLALSSQLIPAPVRVRRQPTDMDDEHDDIWHVWVCVTNFPVSFLHSHFLTHSKKVFLVHCN